MKNQKRISQVIFGIICCALLFFWYRNVIYKANQRNNNPKYTFGVIIGKSTGARGIKYIDYSFVVNGKVYKSFITIDFCKHCINNCCAIGAKVTVKYEADNPSNCALVYPSSSESSLN